MSHPHLQHLETLASDLSPWSAVFPEGIRNIQSLRQEFHTRLERFQAEEQRLSIGIMGQVKAGKSSFVNALLFGGLPVLPEAATPKTANLTAITWGESPLLELEYYTKTEWQALKDQAASKSELTEAKMARELMAMVEKSGLDPMEKIHKQRESISFNSPKDLVSVLNDYAGENGRFTPVIKMIHIYLPMDELKGFEIVDTPGMNDPILSRTEKTREYMARCDVVFFLSRAGQFLDASDTDLLARQLPGRGVKRMVLVAGQFDNVIYEDGPQRNSLEDCEKNLCTRLTRRAEDEMEKMARDFEMRERPALASLMRSMKTPVLSSTFAHGFASWPEDNWGKTMKHMHKLLQEMAEEEWNSRFSSKDWQRISGFDLLQEHYQKARNEKKEILQQQINGLIPESKQQVALRVEELEDSVNQRLDFLNKNEISVINEQRQASESRIQTIAVVLSEVISKNLNHIQKTRAEILADIQGSLKEFSNLSTRTGTETYTSYRTVSTSKWYNPFSWGSSTDVATTHTRSYQYVLASDAVEKVTGYGNESAASINRKFSENFDPQTIKLELRKALLKEMETGSADFNPGWFRSVIEQGIRELQIPVFTMNYGNEADAIVQEFQGEIRSDKMDSLNLMLSKALHKIFERIQKLFIPAVAEVCDQLEKARETLAAVLTENLHKELAELEKAFADKAAEMDSYKKLLARLEEEKK
ncbi:dynamin family protein [Desulfobotulus alkaliphilus]|uniref:Dynamin family protein n=1 Tax=Desulfobotulus alkaliphilus TaxID=622671 RepID=A0A562RXI8_9BACT|nr:dynamin family protein [Desulfobotulus alkaliphilus]TWI73050.1 dynamin family protein [Desulfobotulus alkaliphilus]